MTRQLIPMKLPVSGETIMVIPVSMASETMLTRRQFPAPKPPAVVVSYDGEKRTERNAADPNYLKAYQLYENELQIEVTERILRAIALKQTLTEDQKTAVKELREALDGLEDLPKNDKILWFFKEAIGADADIKAIVRKSAQLADPQEEAIATEIAGF